MIPLREFLAQRFQSGGFTTEDVLSSMLPLMRQVSAVHERQKVAPLNGIDSLHVEGTRIFFEDSNEKDIKNNRLQIQLREHSQKSNIEIVVNTPSFEANIRDQSLEDRLQTIVEPSLIAGYQSWETVLDHHDPLTDIFLLGQLLASMACSIDFDDLADVKRFSKHRTNLFKINSKLHPSVARAITRMTEPRRSRRVPDLLSVIQALENYRQQPVEIPVDADSIPGFESKDLSGKTQILLDRLQKRLFEISRRNRLLQFRSTFQSANLTHASIPLSFDYENIREEQIFVADERLRKIIVAEKPILLNQYLNFEEAIYLPGVLNRIIRESRKDMAEFGFAQLRLVLCMLRWSNLKEQPIETFDSPLVLLPVHLKKKRGIRDTYELLPQSVEAEINPVVRYLFKQLYNIELPETIDLEEGSLDSLHRYLSDVIRASEPAVELEKIERPRIRVLHAQARRRLEQYRRRAKASGRGIRSFLDVDYCYDPANYHPLGIRLFAEKLAYEPLQIHAGESSDPSSDGSVSSANLKKSSHHGSEKPRFEMDDSTESNPYTWRFDLCNLTLANFKYRKMSLVRDYESLVDQQPSNPVFESIFSLKPKPEQTESLNSRLSLEQRFDVVPCDPTQAKSIATARSGDCYIIQGPPGTGKSQTITNLIADFAARGKRVLFVCEKRAAIDVVFARLKKCGLGELCCLIHDSQADKKSFVMNLKQAYETLLESRKPIQSERSNYLDQLSTRLKTIQEFDKTMKFAPDSSGICIAELIERNISSADSRPELPDLQKENLPSYAIWNGDKQHLNAFFAELILLQPNGIFADYPLRSLSPNIAKKSRPIQFLSEQLDSTKQLTEQLANDVDQHAELSSMGLSLQKIDRLMKYLSSIRPLISSGNLELLNPESKHTSQFNAAKEKWLNKQAELKAARETNQFWTNRIPKTELPVVLDSANRLAGKAIPIVFPSWWKIRSLMNRSYNFKAHPVKPTWVSVLNNLQYEYQCEEAIQNTSDDIKTEFGIDDANSIVQLVDSIQSEKESFPDWLFDFHHRIAGGEIPARNANAILEMAPRLERLQDQLKQFVDLSDNQQLDDLMVELNAIEDSLDQLPEFLPCLDHLGHCKTETIQVLRDFRLDQNQLESAIIDATYQNYLRTDRDFQRFGRSARNSATDRLEQTHQTWMEANAGHVCAQVQSRFLEHVQHTSLPDSELGFEQQKFKKMYNEGRRELEHEFGKQMRYKSIRELVSDQSGLVIRDLKPIWLMSPLSVSDTLPLSEQEFDVVIFDEASQIPLESSIPSIFRARQAIVVGDQQQLPPTDFFSSKKEREDENQIEFEEEGDTVLYDLNTNSFLNHAARNINSTMLGWHYRSRNEALISFSNSAFYGGMLNTIPEETLLTESAEPLDANSPTDAVRFADAVFEKPLSYHWMSHGIYEKRRNRAEAEYIAELLPTLLGRNSGHTLGVIAFSEAQQTEIEEAVDRLADTDPKFRQLLDQEFTREEDGQYIGLLIKNLENIQGDERDIIILSICYAPDADGRMIMNFGPINKAGGEKRLNVAISRAKHHMVIVSSIRYGQITNEYNHGANCLRNYLKYAECISNGMHDASLQILDGLAYQTEHESGERKVPEYWKQIANRLAEFELLVDFHVGHSDFRCDLAVRKADDRQYRLGILADSAAYYSQSTDLMNREVFRPRLLQVFGWKTYRVLMKDWLENEDEIVREIVELCKSENGLPS